MKSLFRFIEFCFLLTILILCWLAVFIFQGSIDYHGVWALLPLKFLPLFAFSFLSSLILCGVLSIPKRKRWSLGLALVFVALSFLFQQFKIDPYFKPYEFKNENFSHLSPVKVQSNFQKRLIVSTLEGVSLLPLPTLDQQILGYLEKVVQETLLIFELKDVIVSKGIDFTCKAYAEKKLSQANCLIDFHKEFIQNPTLSAEGNILLTAVGALAVFKSKDGALKDQPQAKRQILLKHYIDILEISLNSCKKAQEIILLSSDHLIDLFEEQAEYKHILLASAKFKELSLLAEKEARSLSEKDQLKRILALKAEMKNLKIENLVLKVRARSQQLEQELILAESKSLFLAFGHKLDEKLSSKIIKLLSATQGPTLL